MIELPSALWIAALALYAGYRLGARDERRKHNRSYEEFAAKTIQSARDLKTTRRLVGEGVSISNVGTWVFGDVGKFKVVIEEHREEA